MPGMCSAAAEPYPICNHRHTSIKSIFLTMNRKLFCLLVVVALYLDSSYEHPCLAKFLAFWLCIVIDVAEPSQVCIIYINNYITVKNQLNFASLNDKA